MSRHSKHSNDRAFYTNKERKDAGFAGFRKDVLGTDCFLPFGHCALSLKAAKDPVVTPDGWVYDREFILENLLRQRIEKQAEAKKYEAQEQRKARQEVADRQEESLKEIEDFRRVDQGLLSEDTRHKRALDKASAADAQSQKKLRQGELFVIDKAQFREKSFWAPECTQSAAPADLKKVDTSTRCPMSGKKLRVKDLLPVKFEVTDQKMLEEGGGRGVYCCAVSKHPITHHQAVVIKPSGVVVLESVLADCVLKDMRCPISNKKLKGPEDILKLQQGGTGFAAHNEVEAKSFSMIRSWSGDARTQAGHLPKAGFVGLH
eukprot:CAMPEP_0176044794 /NCGR_PEP_ID=MMETSP0120_2-20121206/22233_1 /TAXON_ID=160619 /ORGANISM="Kryptoperidinium foliaceum, Strain CCMP 1326" /LENGTH=317 /DNA_ID=CAMNT_0017378199 /DNA_START=53 /DNA_END=1006 /DNA_ORIENTATION=+